MKSARSRPASLRAGVPILALALIAISAAIGGTPTAPPRSLTTKSIPTAQTAIAAVTPNEVRDALDLTASEVISISFGTSDTAGLDVFNAAVASFPSEGPSYLVMSTGNTASALTPNDSPSTTTVLDGLNNSQGNDMTQVVMVLNRPAGATCVAFDFAFLSEEFPEFVGSSFNDAFIAEIGQSTFQIINNQIVAPANFAFDQAGHVVSINTTFGVTAAAAAGTTYDAATPFLTAVSPLEGQVDPNRVTITLTVTDLGDSLYDSTVLIDNVRWFFGLSCTPGADADSDGDALLDDWETNGIDFDGNGTVDLDLPAFGADPQHKDMFIEIDYMVLGGVGGHTHKPKPEALQTMIDTFENAPLTNPDGVNGVHMHIDAGPDSIMNPVTGELWGALSRSNALAHDEDLGTGSNPYDWSEFDAIKGVGVPGSFGIERGDAFHYCIFAHDLSAALTSTSGISRDLPASDFIVSLGSWDGSTGTINQQAGTLMHEFGHNLSLRHGGDDHRNREPNYLSVMNYNFQTTGLRVGGADGTFDYSRFHLPLLNENALNETIGLSGVAGTAGYGTRFFSGGVQRIDNDINDSIDWNFDGDGGTDLAVAVDVNNDGVLTNLDNSNNWAEIKFDGGAVGHLGEQIELPQFTESNEADQAIIAANVIELSVSIGGPGRVALQACESTVYEYVVSNTGESDDIYTIAVSSIQPWADTSGLPAVLPLPAGMSMTFAVPVTVPRGTANGSIDLLRFSATSTSNPLMRDVVETATTVFSVDTDGDGVTDLCDACPTSNLAPTIVIDGCNSGVRNQLFADGCTMSDLIAPCASAAVNHGEFVSCVAHLTDVWRERRLMTGKQKGAIMDCAARAHLP